MGIFQKELKDVFFSTILVIAVVFTLQQMLLHPSLEDSLLFLLCASMVILGFTLFLIGVNYGVLPAGETIGAEIPKRKSAVFMISVIFVISFLITLAEPDVNVFCTLVNSLYSAIGVQALTYAIAGGIGIFLIVAALRIVYGMSMKLLLLWSYTFVILLAIMCPPEFLGMAFDSGGVTTGPMTVPVLLSIGAGICSVVSKRSSMDSFGMIGLASIGPVVAVLLMGIFTEDVAATAAVFGEIADKIDPFAIFGNIGTQLQETLISVIVSIGPLSLFIVLFQKFFLKYPWKTINSMFKGILLAAVGMVVFLTGVYTGFVPVSMNIGLALAAEDGIWIIVLGFILGMIVVIAEPAVKILCDQVEMASSGTVPKRLILGVLVIGVASFVAIGMAKMVFEIDLIYIILPIYVIALIVMWFSDTDMVGIAFDAGGVATGPMSVAVIMTMYAGIATAKYSGPEEIMNSFGIVAMISAAPLVALSLLGIVIRIKKRNVRSRGNQQ
jgi:hypothetical protein